MGCNCGGKTVNPLTGKAEPSDPAPGEATILVLPDGTERKFSTRHDARVENIRVAAGQGSLRPA